MGKREWTIIPKEIIPSMIKSCWKNYQRLRKDAEILFEAKSYQSAIERSLLSIEELSKAIVLLRYYKRQDVPIEIVKKLFNDHKYHFKEFIRYLFEGSTRGGFDKPELLERFSTKSAENQQYDKLERLYVDWKEERIIDPTFLDDYIMFDESDIERFLIARRDEINGHREGVLNKLLKDREFQNALNEKEIDLPNFNKIRKTLKDSGYNSFSCGYGLVRKYIAVSLDSKNMLVNDDKMQEIQSNLQKRYPDYTIIIKSDFISPIIKPNQNKS